MSGSLDDFMRGMAPFIMYANPYFDMYDDFAPKPKRRITEKAPVKKCHRPGCENIRFDNKLYCSKECCLMDKERIKELNKKM